MGSGDESNFTDGTTKMLRLCADNLDMMDVSFFNYICHPSLFPIYQHTIRGIIMVILMNQHPITWVMLVALVMRLL